MAMKKGLGKGLDALIPAGETNSKNGKETPIDSPDKMVNISKVEPNPDQPRKSFAEDELEELADSIKKIGIFQPILVQDKGDHYMIVAGERRWRAALKAGLKEVPVIIKNYTEEEIVIISLLENIQRVDLNPIEEAQTYKKLIDTYKYKQDEVAEKVALGALHYYILQATPIKDMLFNPAESLSFNGNTGPYLQYMGARINSILAKAAEAGVTEDSSEAAVALLSGEDEWALIKTLGDYPNVIAKAAENLDPSLVAAYVYEVAKLFSKFYQNCSIVNAENKQLAGARLYLASCTLQVIKNAMNLVLVPYLERM